MRRCKPYSLHGQSQRKDNYVPRFKKLKAYLNISKQKNHTWNQKHFSKEPTASIPPKHFLLLSECSQHSPSHVLCPPAKKRLFC